MLLWRALILATLLGLVAGAIRTRALLASLDAFGPVLLCRVAAAETNAVLPPILAVVLGLQLVCALTGRFVWRASPPALALRLRPLWTGPWIGLRSGLSVLVVFAALNVVGAASRPRGPSTIVILIDVLGARHMSCYGYERETTPHIDRLAEDAIVFDQAIAQSSFTKTSVASLFTGLWPHHHGVYLGAVKRSGSTTADVLDSKLTTLAESLQAAGYLTAAWVANDQCSAEMGFGQGFDFYDDRQVDVDEMFGGFVGWLERWKSTGPFFAYLHVLDLHGPYRPTPPFDEMFGRPTDMELMTWPEWKGYRERVFDGSHVPTREEVEQLRAWYDGQLAFVDRQVGGLLDLLRREGTYDDSLIVLLADHGDAFMQHGFVGHSTTPFEELIHVPLIVKLPRSRSGGTRVAGPAALVDLAPTLEHLLGAQPHAPGSRDGSSLAAALEGGAPPAREWIYSEYRRRKVVRGARWKYIRDADGARLFDLRADPGETSDVLAEHPELATELAERMHEMMRQHRLRQVEHVELDDESIRKLTEMGYL